MVAYPGQKMERMRGGCWGVANAKGQIPLHRLQGNGSGARLDSLGELQFTLATPYV